MAIAQNQLPQAQDGYFCEYGYWHSSIPNAETLEAMEETEQLLCDPNAKTYASFAELLAEVDAEIEAEESLDVRH